MRTRYLLIFLLVLMLAFVYSCKKKEPEMGLMNIRLTDAPGDYQSVKLDIRKVKIHSNKSHPLADWIELTTNSGVYDMIQLSNGIDTLLANGELPVGDFHTLRIEVGNANTVTANGGMFPLIVPENKIEIPLGANVSEEEESHYLVDIDVRSSIVKDSSGNYVFSPSIRVSDISQTGSIKGFVDPGIANCMVYAIAGFDSIVTYANQSGEFKILGLEPGSYNITAIPPQPTTPGTVPNVQVTAATVKDIGAVQVGH